MKPFITLFITLTTLFFSGCSKKEDTLKVAATLVPQAQMLNEIKPDLENEGINLEIITVEDYNTPNRALADGEVDANFFQHESFLQSQIKQFGYAIVSAAKIHVEPMGGYSIKIKSLDDLKDNSVIAVPNDPTNQARALLLLSAKNLLKLNPDKPATVLNIEDNPHHFHFQEVDAAMLARTLQDVDLAFIPTNFALQAGLTPKDALLIEDANSPYANVLVVREGDVKRKEIQALIAALKSSKMKAFVASKYKGSIVLID